jgi:hypothetical protein
MIEANITVMVIRIRCWARAVGWTAGGAGLMVVAGGPDVAVADGAAAADAAGVGANAVGAADTPVGECARARDCVDAGAAVALGSARAVAAGLGLTSPLQVR